MSNPLYSCQIEACREEVSYPASHLRLLNGKPVCHECYDNDSDIQIPRTFDEYGDPDEMVWWSELPAFVPEHEKRIAELEAQLKEARELLFSVEDATSDIDNCADEWWDRFDALLKEVSEDE